MLQKLQINCGETAYNDNRLGESKREGERREAIIHQLYLIFITDEDDEAEEEYEESASSRQM